MNEDYHAGYRDGVQAERTRNAMPETVKKKLFDALFVAGGSFDPTTEKYADARAYLHSLETVDPARYPAEHD